MTSFLHQEALNEHRPIYEILKMLQGLPNPYGQISLCLNPYIFMAQHTQNLNNTAIRTVQSALYAMFSRNKFGGTFNIKRVKESFTILTVIRSS